MSKTVRNSLNYDHTKIRGEVNTKPSLTVPDQTMSIKEILERFARGLPFQAGKVPIYEGEEEIPDLRTMDLADIQELTESAKENLENQKEKYAKLQKAKAAKKQKEQEEYAEYQRNKQNQQKVDTTQTHGGSSKQ